MKNLLYLFLFLPVISFTQLPNGSFENWTVDNEDIEQPDGWNTYFFAPSIIAKSDNAVDGVYSIFMQNDDPLYNIQIISQFVPTGIVNKLTGQIQVDSTNIQSGAMITVSAWAEGNYYILSQGNIWQPTIGFIPFQYPLELPVAPIDSIRIAIQVGPTPIVNGIAIGLGSVFIDKLALIDSTVVSTNTINPDNQLRFFPNPARDFLHIDAELNSQFNLSIFDITGKLLMQQNEIRQDKEIAIGHLLKGIYIARCETVDGTIYQQKIIKQ